MNRMLLKAGAVINNHIRMNKPHDAFFGNSYFERQETENACEKKVKKSNFRELGEKANRIVWSSPYRIDKKAHCR